MPYGLPWSEDFVRQLDDKATRDEFVADQMRARIALLIRALREQEDRRWTQTELGKRANKPQNAISRIEDPDYGKFSLQTLLDIAAAFDLPLWVDIPEWGEWLARIGEVPNKATRRASFSSAGLLERAQAAKQAVTTGTVGNIIHVYPADGTITAVTAATEVSSASKIAVAR